MNVDVLMQKNRKFALALAKMLLGRGASVTTCDGDGRTCLHAAVLGGFLPCIHLILSQKVTCRCCSGTAD